MLVLVHYAALPQGMCLTRIEIPDDISIREAHGALGAGWAEDLELTRAVGSRWFQRQISVALAVPSCPVPGSINYLLNTHHPDFGRIHFYPSEPFEFDPRLK
jgi:RES domain-containing protein